MRRGADLAKAWAADLDLLLVAREAEEEIVLLALHAGRLVEGADVVGFHLPIVLVLLAAHTVPPCSRPSYSSPRESSSHKEPPPGEDIPGCIIGLKHAETCGLWRGILPKTCLLGFQHTLQRRYIGAQIVVQSERGERGCGFYLGRDRV